VRGEQRTLKVSDLNRPRYRTRIFVALLAEPEIALSGMIRQRG